MSDTLAPSSGTEEFSGGVNPSAFGPATAADSVGCNADAIDWAFFIFAILTLHVFWWALHIPTLFKKGKGWRFYLNDVAWECTRVHSPATCAVLACSNNPRKHWTLRFYSARNQPMTAFGIVRAALTDIGVVVSTVLGIYKLLRGGTQKNLSGLNVSLMMYPSLPQAIYGLLLLTFSRTKLRGGWIITISALMLSAVAVANALVIHYLYKPDPNIWIPSTMFFVLGAFPWIVFSPRLLFLTILVTAFTRNLGMFGASLASKAYFPFCSLRGWKFSGPVLAFAILALLFALYGVVKARPVDEDGQLPSEALALERLANQQKQAQANQKIRQQAAVDQEKYRNATGMKKGWLYLTRVHA